MKFDKRTCVSGEVNGCITQFCWLPCQNSGKACGRIVDACTVHVVVFFSE